MKIDPSDVKLLHVFVAVVEANGIANAQAQLNKDASTISKALAQLEDRLQLRLCERGRHGFRLTSEGLEIYNEALRLFVSLRGLEQKIAALNGVGAGALAIGIIDNIISDANCPLGTAINVFASSGLPKPVSLLVETPANLERYLLDKRIDMAISIFEAKNDYIEYAPLYRELDHLYCAVTSLLGQRVIAGDNHKTLLELLNSQNFVSRQFLNHRELAWLTLKSDEQISHASNIEAVLFLIASGQSVGFLPDHYARPWVANGSLVAVMPDTIKHYSQIEVAYLKSDGVLRPGIAAFLKCLPVSFA